MAMQFVCKWETMSVCGHANSAWACAKVRAHSELSIAQIRPAKPTRKRGATCMLFKFELECFQWASASTAEATAADFKHDSKKKHRMCDAQHPPMQSVGNKRSGLRLHGGEFAGWLHLGCGDCCQFGLPPGAFPSSPLWDLNP